MSILALNAGWLDIAFKVERFINSYSHLTKQNPQDLLKQATLVQKLSKIVTGKQKNSKRLSWA